MTGSKDIKVFQLSLRQPASVHFIRSYQIKFGDLNVKEGVVHQAHHLVFALHAAHIGFKVTARNIFMALARLNNGLYAHYTFAFHFAVTIVGIEYMPVAAQ